MTLSESGHGPCGEDAVLVDYLENRLDARERASREEHLSTCPACRGRLAELYRSRERPEPSGDLPVPAEVLDRVRRLPFEEDAAPRRPATRIPAWGGALAAVLVAALGITLLWSPAELFSPAEVRLPGDHPAQEVFRRGAEDAALSLQEPAAGSSVRRSELELTWRPVSEAREYTVTLLDPLGDILHRESTPETSLRPALGGVELPAEPCSWYVTARLRDGTTVESEIRELSFAEDL